MAEGGESSNRSQLLAHFQEITGLDDEVRCLQLLNTYNWQLELAVQHVFSEREGQPPATLPGPVPLPPTPPPPPGPVPDPARLGPRLSQGTVVIRQQQNWWQWLVSLAFFPLRFVVSTASDLLQFVVNLLFGFQPNPARNPTADVNQFISDFENTYGTVHPDFLRCSYSEALSRARQQLKFLLVYLHSSGHQDTPEFCRSVLASSEFVSFLSTECLCWGVGVGSEEGVRVSYVLRENTYPFLALIVLRQGRMVVCERVEGFVSKEELRARLAAAMRTNEAQLVVERTERARRDVDRSLREQQDQAFQDSLRADREKEERRKQEQREREEREEREREEARKEERQKEEFEAKRAMRISRLPPEPEDDCPKAIHVMLRMPSGERIERRFSSDDKLESVYDFAHTSEEVPRGFTLLTQFPRRELEPGSDGGPLLATLELGKKCVLFVHDSTEED